jgi:hypothetical protein
MLAFSFLCSESEGQNAALDRQGSHRYDRLLCAKESGMVSQPHSDRPLKHRTCVHHNAAALLHLTFDYIILTDM